MNYQLRIATQEQAPTLATILTEASQFKVTHGDMAWGSEPFDTDEANHYLEQGTVYIAYRNDKPVGTFSLQPQDKRIWGDQDANAFYMHRLAITNESHGQGLGQYLLQRAEAETIRAGRYALRLDCDESNRNLCLYYEKNGYTKVGRKEFRNSEQNYVAALYEKILQQH